MKVRQEPKAIFLDMDGTILNHYNQVSENTKTVIDRLRANGIQVFIATGRGKDEIFTLTPEGFAVDGVISSNGMAGWIGQEKIFEHTLPSDLITRVIEEAQKHQVYYELFPSKGAPIVLKEDKTMLTNEVKDPKPETVKINEWLSRKEAIEENKIKWVDQIKSGVYSKFYCFSKNQDRITEWRNKLDALKKWQDFTTSSSSDHKVEIMVAGITKASGIQSFLEHLNLTRDEILAVGDSYNDLKMFELAGQTVSMKNAPADIQALTDEVTTYTCDEDGVYHYLTERFFN